MDKETDPGCITGQENFLDIFFLLERCIDYNETMALSIVTYMDNTAK